MNAEEMQETNGGFGPIYWLLIGIIVAECLDRNAGKDFKDGENAAENYWN